MAAPLSIQDAIEQLLNGRALGRDDARRVMDVVMAGEATVAQTAGLLVALRAVGETADEVAGFVDSMRAHAATLKVPDGTIDTCGTGGDRAGTFNISTAAALVAAGAGIHVAKHGNRAASSRCGSADVLEALGVAIALPPEAVAACVREVRIGFCFAPTFHPAMRHATPARRELGVRTIFNVLGPLANPGQVKRQALGVGAAPLAPLMVRALAELGHERALVFYGEDGLDELTLTGRSRVFRLDRGRVSEEQVDPAALGLSSASAADLKGGAPPENALILRAVLAGERGPRRDVVLLNAAAAVIASGKADEWQPALQLAADSIDSGRAHAALDRLIELSQRLSAA